ncbi:MAG: hypothetical protein GY730_03290 [bacterium]|nr:hypothetical protein [bacterium]
MSPETGEVAASASSNISSDNIYKNSQQENNLDSVYKEECLSCLKSSIQKKGDQQKLNIDDAVNKINILEKSTSDYELKSKLSNLIENLHNTSSAELTSLNKLNELINRSFLASQPHLSEKENMINSSINTSQQLNPYQVKNPFAPQQIPKTEKGKESSLDTNSNNEQSENYAKEEPVPDKKKKLFSFLLSLFN